MIDNEKFPMKYFVGLQFMNLGSALRSNSWAEPATDVTSLKLR